MEKAQMAGVRATKKHSGKAHERFRFWYIDYEGNRKWGTGTTSKKDTLALATKLEEEHRLVRLGYHPLPPAKSKTFKATVDEYIAWGKSQGGRRGGPWGVKHLAGQQRHLEWWRQELNLEKLADLLGKLSQVEKGLRKLQENGKLGKTVASYAESLCALCDWCVQRGLLQADPLKQLKKFDVQPQTVRRAFTQAELDGLLAVATPENRLLYQLACVTGLRANELRCLRVRHLNKAVLSLRLDASWTKNRKDGEQPLPANVHAELLNLSAHKQLDEPLLYVPSHTARTLDIDLGRAKVEKRTEEGKLDFHSFRVTFITLVIEGGANVKEAQTLARHSTPQLTLNVYAKTRNERLQELTAGLGSLVDIRPN
jgi:integrase